MKSKVCCIGLGERLTFKLVSEENETRRHNKSIQEIGKHVTKAHINAVTETKEK
jgi:hypothetical protein